MEAPMPIEPASNVRHRRSLRRVPAVLLLPASALILAACGGSSDDDGVASAGGSKSSPSATASAPANVDDRTLRYVRCLRENGVDVPDPKPGDDLKELPLPKNVAEEKMRQAARACAQHVPGGGLPGQDDPRSQDQLRLFAKCMRDNGVEVPDPSGGRLDLSGVDVRSPEYQKASRACAKHVPGQGPS
jgi:hypothetical protein